MVLSTNFLRLAVLILFLLCIASESTSTRAERLPVRTYTSADGLGSSYVSSIMRDSRGFLWFCTRDGLSRFDGSRFVTYQVGGKNAPPGIEQILETRKGVYWIATTGGLYRFDPNANLVAPPTTGGRSATLNAQMVSGGRGVLYEDRAGNLWIGADGLYRLEERDGKVIWQKVDLNLPEHWTDGFVIGALCEGKDGSLWVVTNRGLLRRMPDGREILYSVEPDRVGVLASVLEDHDSRIWLTSRTGIYIIKPEPIADLTQLGALTIRKLDDVAQVQTRSRRKMRWPEAAGEICKYTQIEGLDNGSTKYLYQTADKHVWIVGGIGPIEFDGQSFNPYTAAQGLAAGLGQAVEDLSGNLWLGGANGLARLNRKGLTTYDAADGLRDSPIDVISESRDGNLNAASEGFFISQFDGQAFHTIRPRLPVNAVASWTSNYAFLDSRNEWWFLTTEGLHRFAATPNINALAQAGPFATYTSSDGLKSSLPFHIFEDSKGDLWISTTGDSGQVGLSRWSRGTQKFHTFSQAEEFPAGKAAAAFAEDRGGNLWLGFYQGGLMRYRDGRFTEFTTRDGLPDGLITALHLDQSGRIWVASSLGGLGRIDDLTATHPNFVTYTTDNGLASNNVRSLTEDLYGNLYAGTARGIDRLSADGLHIKHFSVNDGLAGDFVYAAFRDRNGILWFGTSRGLSRMVPQPDKQTSAPFVWLAGLRIAGESRPVPELGSKEIAGLELTHRQNSLQIDFFAIDFKEGENLRYQYMLEGDKNWGAPSSQRTVNYANLAPGAYRFLVRAVNADGVASAQPATISFRIFSPIWQRWWFVAGCALIVGGLCLSLYRYRIARLREINAALMEAKLAEENLRMANEDRLRELERVRKRIATDLHDDIGSSLTRISLLSEVAQRQMPAGPTSSEGSLSVIAGLSREAVDSMSDIVWAINPEKDSFGDLTQRMRRFAGDVFSARGIEFRFRLPDSDRDLKVGANFRRELFLIFKEAVNNSVRHSGCTEAEIEFRMDTDKLFLKLSDNGHGFEVSDKSTGHGLASMRERTEGLGGTLEIVSRDGEGTTLSFVVPLGPRDGASGGERAAQRIGSTA